MDKRNTEIQNSFTRPQRPG